ncbi:hypothetical protein [Terrisporobacter sp.]|uniref:hypothetical protein n=1 Tax=Terrisporobacter sp. TaxID=1965305 RepID=UPI00262C9D12|nr:hypothetical protein [Terrisporobacter sp.]
MKLERGMVVRFKSWIDIEYDRKFRSDEERQKHIKNLEKLEYKIVTINNVELYNKLALPMIETWEFPGEYFPIYYFDCIIPTIHIEIPKEYLKDNNVVELKNGEKLLYTNNLFCKKFSKFCELNDFSYDLKYIAAPSGGYDIVKIYKNYECKEVLWERK